jgi:hypothetical protein
MTAPLALAEPSEAARAAVRDLLFDDAADFAATIGSLSVRVAGSANLPGRQMLDDLLRTQRR